MPIRIYELAKKLGIQNKDLLDACDKAGIKGKGSALASLDDEEVQKIEASLSDAPPAAPAKDAPEAPKRPDRVKDVRKVQEIPASKTKRKPVKETPEEVPTEEAAAAETSPKPEPETDAKPAPTVAPVGPLARKSPLGSRAGVTPPKASKPAKKSAGPLTNRVNPQEETLTPEVNRRDSHMPSRSGGIRNLDQGKQRKKDGDAAPPRENKRKPGLNVKVAAMPDVQQPNMKAKDSGDKVHKPDISLTREAMEKKVKAAGAAPLSHLTETKKKDNKKKGRAGVGAGTDDDSQNKAKRGAKGEGGALGSTRQSRGGGRSGGMANRRGRGGFQNRWHRGGRKKSGKNTAAPRKDNVVLELPCTIRSFSEATGVGSGQILKVLMEAGTMANINAVLDDETAEMLIEQFEVEVEVRTEASLEESLIDSIEDFEDEEADLLPRPPVVTFLGHVDHGKTSLLDAIIGINVVSGEAGGITQHIRAYSVDKDGKTIAFVDTPGHEAFTEMRARGANVTDIAVLVVAADDGVMPQTEEAISHAKAAGVPIIVALNKIDVPNADPEKALQDLATHELLPSEWGGETEVIRTSAIRGDGMDELLETILVTAELYEYKANPNRDAFGTCLEAKQEPGRGVVAKCIVQNGTLNVGDVVVCGAAHGRVKAMFNTLHPTEQMESAGPSIAIDLTGLDIAPEAGDRLYVLEDFTKARELAETRMDTTREAGLSGITKKVSLEDFQDRLESGSLADVNDELIKLNLIIRADVRGSIEAIMKEMGKLDHPEVEINILQASVGGITVGDVHLASASDAVIIGFNVVPDDAARSLADEKQVEVRRYEIIYKVTDDIKATLEGRLEPERRDIDTGSAMVLRTFAVGKSNVIAGCRVMRGTIERDCRIRLIRDSRIIGDYAIESLRREKDDAKEVRQGMECGIKLAGFNDIKEADTLEAYKVEEFARTL